MLGLTDVDALTLSMTRTPLAGGTPAVAAEAIAVGILANCLMKMALALLLGAPRFRRIVGPLLGAMAVGLALSVLFMR